jgi:hypothetical protein
MNSKKLESHLLTKRARWYRFFASDDVYDPDRFTADQQALRQFYYDNGYPDFRIISAIAELSTDQKDFYLTFTLDEAGFIVGMYAPSRAYKKGNTTEYYAWRGRMYGYKLHSGKQIPTFAEVGWELPTGYFVYWKGEVVGWNLLNK